MYRSASRSVHPIANRCHRTCLSQLSIRHYFRAPPDLPQKRVVITGMGMVSPLGVDVSTSWNRLVAGDCAIQVRMMQNDATVSSLFLQSCDSIDH